MNIHSTKTLEICFFSHLTSNSHLLIFGFNYHSAVGLSYVKIIHREPISSKLNTNTADYGWFWSASISNLTYACLKLHQWKPLITVRITKPATSPFGEGGAADGLPLMGLPHLAASPMREMRRIKRKMVSHVYSTARLYPQAKSISSTDYTNSAKMIRSQRFLGSNPYECEQHAHPNRLSSTGFVWGHIPSPSMTCHLESYIGQNKTGGALIVTRSWYTMLSCLR